MLLVYYSTTRYELQFASIIFCRSVNCLTDRQKMIDLLYKSITCKGTLLSNIILMIYLVIMDVIFQRIVSVFIQPDTLKSMLCPGMAKKQSCCYIAVDLSKSSCSISITINKLNSQLNHALSYPFLCRDRTSSSVYGVFNTVGTIRLFVIKYR